MNETITQLYKRKSVRSFTDRKIDDYEKELIITSALMAPSAGNQQLYTIIDVSDPQLKEKLSVTCDNQPFIAEAKFVLIFCADCLKWYDAYKSIGAEPRLPGAGDLMLAVTDAAIAAQNAVTAAESLGIGSCYIGDIMENCEAHRELLSLPEYVFPCVMLVFGYPTQQQKDRTKPVRPSLTHMVHKNGYHRMNDAELKELLSHNAREKDYTEWLSAFCKRKYNSDFSCEMTRSVEEYLKQFLRFL